MDNAIFGDTNKYDDVHPPIKLIQNSRVRQYKTVDVDLFCIYYLAKNINDVDEFSMRQSAQVLLSINSSRTRFQKSCTRGVYGQRTWAVLSPKIGKI